MKPMNALLCAALGLSLSILSTAAADLAPPSVSQSEDPAGEAQALEVASAYLAGISGGDLDDLDLLFVPAERSAVYENGSDEGHWAHYKEHHLAPEQEAVENFRFATKTKAVERCGDGYVVRHVGGFTVDSSGETRSYRAAVSFVLVPAEGGLRILHLHWSSRPVR